MSRLTFSVIGRSRSGITQIWDVSNNGIPLGQVSWYAQWRKYTFSPYQFTTFDDSCLDEIGAFICTETTRHKA